MSACIATLTSAFEPSVEVKQLIVYIRGPEAGVDMLIDDFEASAVFLNDDWKPAVEERVSQTRFKNISITIRGGSRFSGATDATYEVSDSERARLRLAAPYGT